MHWCALLDFDCLIIVIHLMFKHGAVARLKVWIILFTILNFSPNEHHLLIIIACAFDCTLRFIGDCSREWVWECVVGRCTDLCRTRIICRVKSQFTSGIATLDARWHRWLRWLILTIIIGSSGTSTTVIDDYIVCRDNIIMGDIRLTFYRALTTIELRVLYCQHGWLTEIAVPSTTVWSLLLLWGLATFALSCL